jgi:hypothetical protein
MIGSVCLCDRSVDRPIGDRLVIGILPITVLASGKPPAGRVPPIIDAIGVIGTSTISFRRRWEDLPPLLYLFGCGEAGYGVFVAPSVPA